MALAPIIDEIIINIEEPIDNYYSTLAPEGDGRSRYLYIDLRQNDETIDDYPSRNKIIIEGHNGGGYNIVNECELENNKIKISLANQILSCAGLGVYRISIYDLDNESMPVWSTFNFNILVSECPYDVIRLQASDSYQALSNMIERAGNMTKWFVGNGDPNNDHGLEPNIGDYYLDASNGNIYKATSSNDVIGWVLTEYNIKDKYHIMYSHNSDGSSMTPTPVNSGSDYSRYIGLHIGVELTNPTSPSEYDWFMFRSGINKTQYQAGSSGTTIPSGTWVDNILDVTVNDGNYLWMRVTYDDGSYGYINTYKSGTITLTQSTPSQVDEADNPITLTYSDGRPSQTFHVYNGHKGTSAGVGTPTVDVTQASMVGTPDVNVTATGSDESKVFNFKFMNLKGETGQRGSRWFKGTEITGSSPVVSTFNQGQAYVGDMYINTDSSQDTSAGHYGGHVYACITSGVDMAAVWTHSYVLTGGGGSGGATTLGELEDVELSQDILDTHVLRWDSTAKQGSGAWVNKVGANADLVLTEEEWGDYTDAQKAELEDETIINITDDYVPDQVMTTAEWESEKDSIPDNTMVAITDDEDSVPTFIDTDDLKVNESGELALSDEVRDIIDDADNNIDANGHLIASNVYENGSNVPITEKLAKLSNITNADSTAYVNSGTAGNYYTYNGKLWKALQNSSGVTPTEGQYWTEVNVAAIKDLLGDASSASAVAGADAFSKINSLNTSLANISVSFIEIPSATNTNNPMSIADGFLEDTTKTRVAYVRVGNMTGITPEHPASYVIYEIRQSRDTVTINVINYTNGRISTNGRSKTSNWQGWKTFLPNS